MIYNYNKLLLAALIIIPLVYLLTNWLIDYSYLVLVIFIVLSIFFIKSKETNPMTMELPESIKETDKLIESVVGMLNKKRHSDTLDSTFELESRISELREHRIELEREQIVDEDRMK